MAAKWPAMQQPKGAKLDNDKSHGHTDPNSGGGPAAPVQRNFKRVPDASRGGHYQSGQRQYANTSIRGTRGGTGNPANRGSITPVGRQSFPSEERNPNGGGPQVRDDMDTVSGRGGYGNDGMAGLPGVRSNPKPSAGNTGGKMARRISGHFNNRSKGKNAGGNVGSYGDRAPITANT